MVAFDEAEMLAWAKSLTGRELTPASWPADAPVDLEYSWQAPQSGYGRARIDRVANIVARVALPKPLAELDAALRCAPIGSPPRPTWPAQWSSARGRAVNRL